mmetsp:Transcript_26953/g.38658  ORF Transcript_26953/g.38658 Transcript_26953/m.38658 type:complete len:146 (+) Transcript_26953:65-502(+)
MTNSYSRLVPASDGEQALKRSGRRPNSIFVRCPHGKTLLVSPDDRLSVIQQRVYNETGLRSCYQVIQCNAKPLFDTKLSLNEYGVENNSTIFVSARTRGGCFMVSFSILCIIVLACIMSVCTCGCSLCIIPFLLPLLFVLPLFCL